MAAAIITVHSLAVELAKSINDAGYSFMSLVEYTRFPLQCRTGPIQSYVLTQIGTSGVWDYNNPQGNSEPLAIWLENGTAPLTSPDNDCTYQVYCLGPSIFQSAGTTDTVTSFTLSGFPVNFREAKARVKEWVADNRAVEYSQSIGNGSISPEAATAFLRRDAMLTRGAYGG